MQNSPYYAPNGRVEPAAQPLALRLPFALRWVVEFSACDWMVLAYLCNLNLLVLFAPAGPARSHSSFTMGSLLALFVFSLLLVRAFKVPFLGALAHRASHFLAAVGSYAAFAEFLPLVNTGAYDVQLYEVDLALFGVEPAVYMDRFVNSWTTEWFAFFYLGYFILLLMHVVPILLFVKNERIHSHFTMGMLVVCCVGQTLYTVVPGFGPAHALPQMFEHELPSGMWWNWVAAIVASNGAQKDIFPSLHTALPLFLLLFTFDNRKHAPFCYTWPGLAFFVANIIGATMFLRWHYVIDVVAGVLLATLAHLVARTVARWEPGRRTALGLGKAWPNY